MFDNFMSYLNFTEDGYGDHWDPSMETPNDPPPDHDLLAEDVLPSPIDDHSTYGCAANELFSGGLFNL